MKRKPTLRCSIIIPVFNKSALTWQCLEALLKHPPQVTHEIIVVDDASTDDTREMLHKLRRRVRLVRMKRNSGFARACNAGAESAHERDLVFLNNDTIPQPGWLDALARYADAHPRAAVVGAKMLFPDDTIQHAGVVICQDRVPRHVYAGFPKDHPAVNKSRPFQIVTAGCALFRRKPFEKMSGFDPAYLNGFEDVDLCLRLGALGHEIHYCHESVVCHLESVSRDVQSPREAHNSDLYRQRWAERVRPDDIDYYIQDGLLALDYRLTYPMQISISPTLGTVQSADRQWQADQLLNERSRQLFHLLRENVRLNVLVSETRKPDGTIPTNAARASKQVHHPRLVHRGRLLWLCDHATSDIISILIPVKNGADHLCELLPRILEQKVRQRVEIIAIDSGSTDNSVDVLRAHDATVYAIDPADFNHGLTRNLLAERARGEVLVYLVQDALPADDHWLANLIAPLRKDSRLAGVCSRALPRPDAGLLVQRDCRGDLNGASERSTREILDRDAYERLPHHPLRVLINFHNMSSAIRASVHRKIPFRRVEKFGEDLLWAKQVLEAGYRIQHEPTSTILHSHDYTLAEILQRNYDDGAACREIVGRTLSSDEVVPLITALAREDWQWLAGECGLTGDTLESWQMQSLLRRAAQITGQWLGVNAQDHPVNLAPLLSLTEKLKFSHPRDLYVEVT